MTAFSKWGARLGAMITAVSLAVFVPVAAWAATGTGEVVVEAAKRRSKGGGGVGFFGLLCCLVVVGLVVLAVYLVMRNRRGRR
jgi:hypothetical protein